MAAPESLSETQQKIWDEFVGKNYEETPELEILVIQVSRLREAQRRIDKDGLIVTDEKGRPIKHPALEIESDASKLIRQWVD